MEESDLAWLRNKTLIVERNQNKLHFLEFLDCHKFDAWIKVKNFSNELSSTNRKYSIKALIGGIIPVVTEPYELDFRNKTIILNLS